MFQSNWHLYIFTASEKCNFYHLYSFRERIEIGCSILSAAVKDRVFFIHLYLSQFFFLWLYKLHEHRIKILFLFHLYSLQLPLYLYKVRQGNEFMLFELPDTIWSYVTAITVVIFSNSQHRRIFEHTLKHSHSGTLFVVTLLSFEGVIRSETYKSIRL